jgi:iron complex transport system substrate-binding protein
MTLRAFAAATLLLFLSGCEGEASDAGADSRAAAEVDAPTALAVTDDAGRRWAFDAPPERIVSLVPAATRTLVELGLSARLVGRTDYDPDPELAHLPSVGGGLEPSTEVLLSLRPELVVRFLGPSDEETGRRLDRAGIPHLAVRPDTLGDVFRMIELLGVVTGEEAGARELSGGIRTTLEEVARAVEGAPRPRVGILLGGDPPWVAGGSTFLHELVEVAGGENVFADTDPLYAPISVEEVLRRNPDLLLLTEGARIPQALSRIPVVRAPSWIQSPGPDVARAARTVGALLHPERFP